MPWAIPWDDLDRPIIKRILYRSIDGLVHLITTRPLNRLRKSQGLPPVGDEGFTSAVLNLVPVSPVVFPPNPLWKPNHRMVGYWFARRPDDWAPPGDLMAFLDNGTPPILISLGAMSLGQDDALESARLFVEAVRQANLRAIIQGWETGIKGLTLPSGIYAAGSVPHGWLMPRCAGVVHHGGYGTTAAGLRAGIPALVIPHIADQFYWGRQVQELGVGPVPIPRTKLEVKNLAAAMDELAQDDNLRTRAASIGEQIRSENGIDSALQLIKEKFE
jgi:UDP:flavonoid glycosyltransferase YjiC (YdhE family)